MVYYLIVVFLSPDKFYEVKSLLHLLAHVVPEAFFDVLKTVPLLLVVYALLYYIENRLTNTPALLSRAAQFGPVVGALAGTIPQCGFSAAARCV